MHIRYLIAYLHGKEFIFQKKIQQKNILSKNFARREKKGTLKMYFFFVNGIRIPNSNLNEFKILVHTF